MSGTIEISDGAVWMPAGWILDRVLEQVAGEVAPSDQALAVLLRNAQTDKSAYCDLRQLDSTKFRLLLQSAERALDRAQREGSGWFSDPSFFQGFVERLREFVEMLRADPRVLRVVP